jgi:hypothetical protein
MSDNDEAATPDRLLSVFWLMRLILRALRTSVVAVTTRPPTEVYL